MNTHNICFCGEIRKNQYFWIEKKKNSILSRAMSFSPDHSRMVPLLFICLGYHFNYAMVSCHCLFLI